MKKIAVAVALMCALSAYVSYPKSGRAVPSLALSLQETRSLPIEAYDAV
jgi:hypothetical protein